ncbi:MAG TPA: CoA ester lyase [Bryobacteraceae bacterium]|jgi:citrate lyase subunit beta/citryl-CoA lyase|nr:CoA ester lyase [Bryobacteraceae bacterium]
MSAPRSYLFVPGNRPERFPKALASGADAVIIDLEDAVPPAERAAARANVAAWVSPERCVFVRVNGAQTEWFRDDVAMCEKAHVAGVVLPKAERVEDVQTIGKPVLPIIETAQGFWNVSGLAHASNVQRLMFGSIDFQLDLGINGEGEELLYFRSQLVLVSRIAGLPAPVDGVTVVFDTPDAVRADTQRARRLGFGGKLCIHPKQTPTVNECFGPTAEERTWATRIVEAAVTAGGAAIQVDGEMIDRPVIARAEAILSQVRSKS